MAPINVEMLQGTLDMLVLRTLLPGELHGWGISQRIRQISGDVLRVNQGSLYPALVRLLREGWIEGEWGTSDNNRRAKFYKLTRAGKRRLEQETDNWERLASAVARILRTA